MASDPPVTARHLFAAFLCSRARLAQQIATLEQEKAALRRQRNGWRRKYYEIESATYAGERRIGR